MARLKMLCPSAKGLHPSRIALFRVTEGDLIGGSKNISIATLLSGTTIRDVGESREQGH
jgi:hypothetical protein